MLSTQSQVADIVSRSPGVSAIFDKYHIDFCCGGAISLQSACESKGLSPASVLAEIQESIIKNAPPPRYNDETGGDNDHVKQHHDWLHEENVNTIIDHILDTYHAPLKTEMIRLDNLMNKVAKRHGPDHPELLEIHSTSESQKIQVLLKSAGSFCQVGLYFLSPGQIGNYQMDLPANLQNSVCI